MRIIRFAFVFLFLVFSSIPVVRSADYSISVNPAGGAPGDVIEVSIIGWAGTDSYYLSPIKMEDDVLHTAFNLVPVWDEATSSPSEWVQSGTTWKRLFKVFPAAIEGKNIVYLGSNKEIYAEYNVERTGSVELPSNPVLEVSPDSGPSGMNVAVEGRGFPENEKVTITWEKPYKQFPEIDTKNGLFSSVINVPRGSEIGSHTVAALSGSDTLASDSFTVTMYLKCRLGYYLKLDKRISDIKLIDSGESVFLWDPYDTGQVTRTSDFDHDMIDLRIPGPGPLVFEFHSDTLTALIGLQ